MSKIKVLIIGGGFAGVKSLRKLSKYSDFEVTMITDQETFRYGATIWRATTGHLKEASYLPVADLIPIKQNVKLIYDKVLKINKSKRVVSTEKGKDFHYDYCVIGIGVITSYFGIKGLDKYSFSVKSSKAFDEFRQHLHQEIIEDHALDKNYVVVGGGPTGIEISAALKYYLKDVAKHHQVGSKKVNVRLVEAAPRLLPNLPESASKRVYKHLRKLGVKIQTSTVVTGETATTLKVGNETVETKTVVWTAGVSNNPFFDENKSEFALNDKKRVIVDGHLRVDDHTFVIGDSAATPYSGYALTALHNADYVTKYIINKTLKRDTKPYRPTKPLCIIPVGEKWAILNWKGMVISGKIASILRMILDYVGYAELMTKKAALKVWLKSNHTKEECAFCKSD